MDLVTLALAKKYTNQKVNNILSFGGFEIVESLPTSDISHSTVYLLKSSEEARNIYTEYIYTKNNEWESLGTTVDLNGYITEENLQEAIDTALAQARDSGEFKPVKGEDYWTEDDKQEIINEVVAEMPEGGTEGLVYEELKVTLPTIPSISVSELYYAVTKIVNFNGAYIGLLGQQKGNIDWTPGPDYRIYSTDLYLYSTDGLNWETKEFINYNKVEDGIYYVHWYGNWVDYTIGPDGWLYILDGAGKFVYGEEVWDDEGGSEYQEIQYTTRSSKVLRSQDGITWEELVLPEDKAYSCITTMDNSIFIGAYETSQLIEGSWTEEENGLVFNGFNVVELNDYFHITDMVAAYTSSHDQSEYQSHGSTKLYFCSGNKLYYYGRLDDSLYSDNTEVGVVACGEAPFASDILRIEREGNYYSGYLIAFSSQQVATCRTEVEFQYGPLIPTPDWCLPNDPKFYNWMTKYDFSQYLTSTFNGYLEYNREDGVKFYCDVGFSYEDGTGAYVTKIEDKYLISFRHYKWENLKGVIQIYPVDYYQFNHKDWNEIISFIKQSDEPKEKEIAQALWPDLQPKVIESLPKEEGKMLYAPTGPTRYVGPYSKRFWHEAEATFYARYEGEWYYSQDRSRSFFPRSEDFDGLKIEDIIGICGKNILVKAEGWEGEGFYTTPNLMSYEQTKVSFTDKDGNEQVPSLEDSYGFVSGEYQGTSKALLFNDKMFALSTDNIEQNCGESWDYYPGEFNFTANAKALYGNDKFILWDESNNIHYLKEDNTWDISTALVGKNVRTILFGQGIFLTEIQTDTDTEFWSSLDGIEWQLTSLYSSFKDDQKGVVTMVYYGDKFVIPGINKFYASYDGVNWFICNSPKLEDWVDEPEPFDYIYVWNNDIVKIDSWQLAESKTFDGGKTWEPNGNRGDEISPISYIYPETNNDPAVKADITRNITATIFAEGVKSYEIALSPEKWNTETQTCKIYLPKYSVNKSSTVLITPLPIYAKDTYNAGIYCIEQGADYIVIQCNNIPTSTVGIKITVIQVFLRN